MARIVWDAAGTRHYETGVDRGVLYVMDASGNYPTGVPWNGLISVTESPSGAEPSPLYADNIKYLTLMSVEEFAATIEAYTYPDEFAQCDGSAEAVLGVKFMQQARKQFGLCYRTRIGNDVDGDAHGYKIHLVYGCLAAPSEKAYQTVNESPEAITFSWELTTTPPALAAAFRPTACIVIDSTKVAPADWTALEDVLYGDDSPVVVPSLPLPDAIITLMTP